MTEREVIEEFVDAMRILSMSYRNVQEIADILNPIGDRARWALATNIPWSCRECLTTDSHKHKMDCESKSG